MAFYDFARAADDIADHPTAAAGGEAAAARCRMDASLTGAVLGRCAVRQAARAARRAKAVAVHALDLLKAFRQDVHQAALRQLGRTDRLLHLFGDAGRALRARRAWRGPIDLGVVRTCFARCCRSSITCRIAARTIALSNRVYLPQDMPARSTARRPRHFRRRRPSPALLACHASTDAADADLFRFAAAAGRDEIRDTRLACEVAVIDALAAQAHRAAARLPIRWRTRCISARARCLIATMIGATGSTLLRRHRLPRGDRTGGSQELHDRDHVRQPSTSDAAQHAGGSSFYLAMRILPRAEARGDVRGLQVLPPGG